jgi:site-specific DNA-adenine methylase
MTENRYPGGKGTFFQRIINLMPPHRFYIETHVGGGAVIRHKRPAEVNVAIDLDPAVKKRWQSGKYLHVTFYQADALKYLEGIQDSKDVLIYADPPYMLESRKSGKMYSHEYTDEDHLCLLCALKSLDKAAVIISGYWTPMYQAELKDWTHTSFEVMTRGGPATEHLWFNYDWPIELHEYTYLGDTFRDRERIRRKRKRWLNNLRKMDGQERLAMLEAIRKEFK